MRGRLIFILAPLGVVAGIVLAVVSGAERPPQAPAFKPVSSPWNDAIFATGIVESELASGQNTPIYPEVSGVVTRVGVVDGAVVSIGDVLFALDDRVPRTALDQARRQADAAEAALAALRAQPRPEALAVADSQVRQADATWQLANDQYEKRRSAAAADAGVISREALDTARGTRDQARAALEVARRQAELVRAGAWSFDIEAQTRQRDAAREAVRNAEALLDRYTVRARTAGRVLSVGVTVGATVGPNGLYNSYTQTIDPALTLGSGDGRLAVRCYVDEILVSRLPPGDRMQARMTLRGTEVSVPLEFARIQPSLIPKIALSNARQERVDLRVLPVIFRFEKPEGAAVYPGQLVDVYIASR
jgi:HlyD family secretion protein